VRLLLDTNIVLRNALRDEPLYREVHEALERAVAQGWELCITNQNVIEFWVVATRPQAANGIGLIPEEARREVDEVLNAFTLLPDPPDLLQIWLELCTGFAALGRVAYDARLVALMKAHEIEHLLTLDAGGFGRYPDITCLTPAQI
jgi:predicted nucleic acid-binding protein